MRIDSKNQRRQTSEASIFDKTERKQSENRRNCSNSQKICFCRVIISRKDFAAEQALRKQTQDRNGRMHHSRGKSADLRHSDRSLRHPRSPLPVRLCRRRRRCLRIRAEVRRSFGAVRGFAEGRWAIRAVGGRKGKGNGFRADKMRVLLFKSDKNLGRGTWVRSSSFEELGNQSLTHLRLYSQY